MNKDVLYLCKETLKKAAEEIRAEKEFDSYVRANNEFMYYEIYQDLTEQFLKDPIDETRNLIVNITLKPKDGATEKEKEIINKKFLSGGYRIYESKHKGNCVVVFRDVEDMLREDGFNLNPRTLYNYSGSLTDDDKDLCYRLSINC